MSTNVLIINFIFIYLYIITGKCSATCYLTPEMKGTYVTQSSISGTPIQYNEINVTEDSIPIWGMCHKRIKNNVILMISSEETTCFRCFNLKLVARNILRVCTTDPDYISKCYTNEQKALASCPSDQILQNPSLYTEIILYKSLEANGQDVRREYCPVNGRYKFNYNNDDGHNDNIECQSFDSELDNCPSGSSLNLRFRKCSFEDHELTFECLGHWEGHNNEKYLAVINAQPAKDMFGPQYRCATYKTNEETGSITISFSKDSTCSAINFHARTNDAGAMYTEILTLEPKLIKFSQLNYLCNFPYWLQGQWQHISVKNNTFIYYDETSFKAYTMKCLQQENDKFLVSSRTQCDEESFMCIKIKNRSQNVIEFQRGIKTSNSLTKDLCSEEYFDETRWLTQGRLDKDYTYTACPISGELTGILPDASELCAKLSSNCSSENEMYYRITACGYNENYEERYYRCLGQWNENNFIYAYTKRLDIGTFECFVGIKQDEQIFIKEAGEDCQRKINPLKYGMELHTETHCKYKTKVGHPVSRFQVAKNSKNFQIETTKSMETTTQTSPKIITTKSYSAIVKSNSVSIKIFQLKLISQIIISFSTILFRKQFY